jgi:protein-tyrosine-phosphatase
VNPLLARRALAEFLGTGLLVAVVVGSGIMATNLTPDVGLQLLANSTATVFGLAALILMLGPVSGAHFNPVVTLADFVLGRRSGDSADLRAVAVYLPAQIAGGIGGSILANLARRRPAQLSARRRSGGRNRVERPRLVTIDTKKPSVLFVCVHNAGRSQMAAGFLTRLAGDRVIVRSAGSAPAGSVNPAVVEAMNEVGVDLSHETPKVLTDEAALASDYIVTMGCGDACPVHPGKKYLDWVLTDPAGQGVEAVRPIRDEIEQRIRALIADIDAGAVG